MLKKYIYLAGPIAGLNEQEATEAEGCCGNEQGEEAEGL